MIQSHANCCTGNLNQLIMPEADIRCHLGRKRSASMPILPTEHECDGKIMGFTPRATSSEVEKCHGRTISDLEYCATLGQVSNRCGEDTSSSYTRAASDATFDQENGEPQAKAKALPTQVDEVGQLVQEDPVQRLEHLCAERAAALQAIRTEVEAVEEERRKLNEEIKNGEQRIVILEKSLRRFKVDKKKDPGPEYFLKNVRQKKGKCKADCRAE